MNKNELIEKYEYLNHDYLRRVDTSEVLRDLKQLDEPKKVKVPQFVADWIEEAKTIYSLSGGITFGRIELNKWLAIDDNQEIFALAWILGYEVEEEPKYTVRVKGIEGYGQYLNKALLSKEYFFASNNEVGGYKTKFTRKELEEAGFGWVFDCEGIEIEEVEK